MIDYDPGRLSILHRATAVDDEGIPVPDPRLSGPGAGCPATQAQCRISGCRAGNSYPGPDPRLPGPGAGPPATGPAKKTQKIEKNNFGVRKIDIMIVFL